MKSRRASVHTRLGAEAGHSLAREVPGLAVPVLAWGRLPLWSGGISLWSLVPWRRLLAWTRQKAVHQGAFMEEELLADGEELGVSDGRECVVGIVSVC